MLRIYRAVFFGICQAFRCVMNDALSPVRRIHCLNRKISPMKNTLFMLSALLVLAISAHAQFPLVTTSNINDPQNSLVSSVATISAGNTLYFGIPFDASTASAWSQGQAINNLRLTVDVAGQPGQTSSVTAGIFSGTVGTGANGNATLNTTAILGIGTGSATINPGTSTDPGNGANAQALTFIFSLSGAARTTSPFTNNGGTNYYWLALTNTSANTISLYVGPSIPGSSDTPVYGFNGGFGGNGGNLNSTAFYYDNGLGGANGDTANNISQNFNLTPFFNLAADPVPEPSPGLVMIGGVSIALAASALRRKLKTAESTQ